MKKKTLTILVTLLLASCRPSAERPEPPEPPGKEPGTRPVEEEEPENPCGDPDGDEWKERNQTFLLVPHLTRARLQHELIDFIDAIRLAARRRSFGEMDAIVEEAYASLALLRPDTSGDERNVLLRSVRNRSAVHSICMALAEDDVSWCTSLDEAWEVERGACQVMHTVYVRIASRAVLGKTPCAQAMAGSPEVSGYDARGWIDACEAIKAKDPGRCPTNLPRKVGVMCRAAAARSGTTICRPFEDERHKLKKKCCEKFAWRLGELTEKNTGPEYLPERAALDGDAGGCDRALAFGLFRDLASTYKVPDAPEPPRLEYSSDDYVCLFQVYHSMEKLPGAQP